MCWKRGARWRNAPPTGRCIRCIAASTWGGALSRCTSTRPATGWKRAFAIRRRWAPTATGFRAHSTVIFPFYTQTGGPGQVRQEFQIRVPVDDTHTYHINYGCYLAPEGVAAPPQEINPLVRSAAVR